MADVLLEAYRSIPVADRQAALADFVRGLGSHEQHNIEVVTCERRDPIQVLPLELVITILDYLPACNVWRLRAVNRRWQECLSREAVEFAALSYNTTPARHGQRTSKTLADDSSDSIAPSSSEESPGFGRPASLSNLNRTARLRKLQAIHLHEPFAFLDIGNYEQGWSTPRNLSRGNSTGVHHMLRGCYVLQPVDFSPGSANYFAIRIYDLATYTTKELRSEDRGTLNKATLSEELAAYATYAGRMYVTHHANFAENSYTIRLPSANIVALASDGHIVVALQVKRTGGLRIPSTIDDSTRHKCDTVYSLVIHDASDSTTRTVDCGVESSDVQIAECYSVTMLVDSTKRHVDIFEACLSDLSNFRKTYLFVHTRCDFDGRTLCQSRKSIWDLTHGNMELSEFAWEVALGDVEYTGVSGIYRLHFLRNLDVLDGAEHLPMWFLMFDAQRAELFAKLHPRQAEFEPQRNPVPRMALWKDRIYRSRPMNGSWNVFKDREIKLIQEYEDNVSAFVTANDDFVVQFDIARYAIRVYYFDERAIPPAAKRHPFWADCGCQSPVAWPRHDCQSCEEFAAVVSTYGW